MSTPVIPPEVDDVLKNGGQLFVTPEGQKAAVPKESIADAHSKGWKPATIMTTDKGQLAAVPFESVKDAVAQGWIHGQSTPQFNAETGIKQQPVQPTPAPTANLDVDATRQANAARPLWKKLLGLPASDQVEEQEKQNYVQNVQPKVNATLDPTRPVREGAQAARNYISATAASLDPDMELQMADPNASPLVLDQNGKLSANPNPSVDVGPAVVNAYKKVLAPAAEASATALEGQYEPETLATLGLFKYLPAGNAALRAAKTGAAGYYAGTAGKHAVESGTQAVQEAAQGNIEEAIRKGTEALFSTGFAAEGGADAIRGTPQAARDTVDVARGTGRAIVRATPAAIGSRIYPESVQSTEQLGKTSAREAKRQTENFAAALETGGKPERGVMTFEDVAQPITDAVRTEAARQNITPQDFDGRNGYEAGRKITAGVRSEYDQAYDRILDPLRGDYAGKAARQAAQEVYNGLASNAELIDELTRSGNLEQLTALSGRIARARTIGELDDLRKQLNQLSALFEGKSEAQQYQAPLFKRALSDAADAIRNSLYNRMEQAYGGVTVNGESQGISENAIRQLQREHGAAIKADQLMQESARALSSAESEHQSPPSVFRRLFGTAYRATLSRTPHAAAGVLERLFPGSKLEDFNTQMKRVLQGGEPAGYQFPEAPTTPEYVEPRTEGPTNSIPGNLKLKAAPPVAEQPVPKALPPGPDNALPPGQYEQPPSTERPRRLGPIRMPAQAAPQSSAVEPVGLPATAEPAAVQSHFEQKGAPKYTPRFLRGGNSVQTSEIAQNRPESVSPSNTPSPTLEASPASKALQPTPKEFTQPTPKQYQEGERVSGVEGKPTSLLTSSGQMGARYRIVEADTLIPSHDAMTFAKNGQYPEGVQERAYHSSKEAQNRVIQQSQNYEPAYTVNSNPDAVNGPPVVTPDGVVLGGNSRTMSTQRLYGTGKGEAYKTYLREHAADFGFTPEQVDSLKQPILVREVAAPGTVEEARRVGSELNKSMTGALGVSEKAVSAGKSITSESLSQISGMMDDAGEGASLRTILADRGRDIVQMLTRDGVITERERPAFVDTATGGLSEEGKTFVERALRGAVVGDPDLMDRAPKNVLQKIDSSLGDLASVGARPDEYNIMPVVRGALAAHADIAQRGTSVDLYLGQTSMFGETRSPVVDAMTRAFAENPKSVRGKIRQFAQDAKFDVPGQAMLAMGPKPSAVDAFNSAFGTKLSQEQFIDGMVRAYQEFANENGGTIPPNGQTGSTSETGGSVRGSSSGSEESGSASSVSGKPAETQVSAPTQETVPDEASQRQAPVSSLPPSRFESGKKLTPEQRQQVIGSLVDVYRAKGAPIEEKGQARESGDVIKGYKYSPELFERSDITGKPIRYYVTLPDGRKAHPSELYPELTDSAIQKELINERERQRQDEAQEKLREHRIVAPDANATESIKSRANYEYHKTGRSVEGSYFATDSQGRMVRVDGKDPRDVARWEKKGFSPESSQRQSAVDLDRRNNPQEETPQFKNWFGDSKVVDSEGKPVVVYRGDYRADRVGNKFKVNRSTSGRFYFTEDPEIASKYAEGKPDTNFQWDNQGFHNWYKFPDLKYKGERTVPNLQQAWYRLSPEQKTRVKDVIENTTLDDNGEFVFDAGNSIYPNSDFPRLLREHHGNWLKLAEDIWLSSGNLFNYEGEFTKILDEAGLNAVYDNPHDSRAVVTPVYLSIKNPLDTANIPQNVVDALRRVAKADRSRAAEYGVDLWDKTTITPKEWMTALEQDLKSGDTHAWTRVPEKITKALQEMGYDGIKDTGGKMGGDKHTVWIAFEPNQIKSATGNKGTFDPTKDNILMRESGSDNNPNSLLASLAKNSEFDYQEPKDGIPGHVKLNNFANQIIQRAAGRKFVGTNTSVAGAARIIARLDDYSEQLKVTNPQEAAKVKELADTLENATDPSDGLTLISNQGPTNQGVRTVHEELTHSAVQRRPGKGDVFVGVPYQQMLNDPSILAEHPKISGYEPGDQVRAIAESFVDWLNGEHSLDVKQAQSSAETYLHHLVDSHGVEPVRDAERVYDYVDELARQYGLIGEGEQFDADATAAGRQAIANVLSERTGESGTNRSQSRERQTIQANPEGTAGRESSSDRGTVGTRSAQNRTGNNPSDRQAGNRPGLDRGYGEGMTPEELRDFISSAGRHVEIREVGEQGALFGSADKVFKVINKKTGESVLATESQINSANSSKNYAGAQLAQPSLFRSGVPKFLRSATRR